MIKSWSSRSSPSSAYPLGSLLPRRFHVDTSVVAIQFLPNGYVYTYKNSKKYFTSHTIDYSLQKKINNYRKRKKIYLRVGTWNLKAILKDFLMVLKGQINFKNFKQQYRLFKELQFLISGTHCVVVKSRVYYTYNTSSVGMSSCCSPRICKIWNPVEGQFFQII